jgi:iron-sulfur cluster insertion protein
MDNNKSNEDEIIERDGSLLLVDRISLPYLDQATIDYKESLIKSAFQVVENKNAEMNCSCGTSFSPKMDKK